MMQCLGDHDQLYRYRDDTRFYARRCDANDFETGPITPAIASSSNRYQAGTADVVRDIGL